MSFFFDSLDERSQEFANIAHDNKERWYLGILGLRASPRVELVGRFGSES